MAFEITAVETATVTLPLPRPLTLGAMQVINREYTGIRITTADGLTGTAYCLSRDAPLEQIITRLLSGRLQGADSTDPAALWDYLFRATAISGRVGLVRKALGLVDIALWDIAAQRAGVPLWQLLQTGDAERDCVLVACYPDASRQLAEMVEEIVDYGRAGWPLLKISRSPNQTLMRELLQRVQQELPAQSQLIIDAGFGWHNSAEALADMAAWGHPTLAWLEDPLLPEDITGCAEIRRGIHSPLGVGDEVTDPRVLIDLMDHGGVNVLRLDIVAIGGITPARKVIAAARERHVPVSGHVYPEVSVHLGIGVETFDREGNHYDPAAGLIDGGPGFAPGRVTPPSAPGLGFTLREFRFDPA